MSGRTSSNLRADSIHILTLRPRQGTGALVGFPRDSWIQGSKLTDLMPGRGPEGMQQILEETTGLDLEGWVAVGFEGFLGLMGDLGNLEITLPTAMPSGNSWADYPEGEQSLDPQLALRLARIRKDLPNGDLDRTVNQGRIILAALTMVQDLGLVHLPEWVASYSNHGFTSLGTEGAGDLRRRRPRRRPGDDHEHRAPRRRWAGWGRRRSCSSATPPRRSTPTWRRPHRQQLTRRLPDSAGRDT